MGKTQSRDHTWEWQGWEFWDKSHVAIPTPGSTIPGIPIPTGADPGFPNSV